MLSPSIESFGLVIPPKWIRDPGEPIDSQGLRRKQENCYLDDDEFFWLRDDAERNDESGRPSRRMAYAEQDHERARS